MSTAAGQPDVEIPEKERYTYEDYQQLPEGAPYELIRGQLVRSPSPSVQHQRLVRTLSEALGQYARTTENSGEVLFAPIDVHLSEDIVVQPDVLYISQERSDRIGTHEIDGAPDLVMEVVSPSSSHRDVLGKKQLYESTGVREYWIIDPDTETVEIYVPGEEGYVLHQRHVSTGRASSSVLEGFDVDLVALFP